MINYEKQDKIKILYWMLEDSNKIRIDTFIEKDIQVIYGDKYYIDRPKKDKYKKKVFKDILKDTDEFHTDEEVIIKQKEYNIILLTNIKKIMYYFIAIIFIGYFLDNFIGTFYL